MIDIEALLTSHLKAKVTGRVYGETPDSTAAAWVKVALLDTDDRTQPTDHLLRHFIQIDCYGPKVERGPEAQGPAFTLASQVRTAIRELPTTDFTGAVVTSVVIRGPRRLPDLDFNPARQRYILEAEVCVHP